MKLDIIRVVNGTLIRDQDQAKGLFDSAIASGELELSVVRSSVLDGTKSRRSRLNKRTAWEYKTIKIKPVSKAEFISNCMERKVDDVREIAFIKHRDSPDYVNTAEGFHLYYSAKNGKASQMFLRISYLAGDWLFIKRYIIKTDKNTYTITPKEVSRDNGILNSGSRVWEWCDYPVDESHYEMIRDIAKSKSVTVRYDGTEYYKDFEPDQEKRDRLTAVLESYLLDSQ